MMRPDPALDRQLISKPRPARPLVLEWDADLRHRSPLRQEDILDRPVKAAGAAQTRDIPTPRHDFHFGPREHPAPVERPAVRVRQLLAVIADHLKAPQHPAGLLTAAAELPPTGDPVAA